MLKYEVWVILLYENVKIRLNFLKNILKIKNC